MTILLLIILLLLILNPDVVSKEVINSCHIWITILLPTMYPSFIIIDLLANSPLIYKISNLIYPIFKRIFNIKSPKSIFIILISLICGSPASTNLIKNSFINDEISKCEAENLICTFSSLSLPYTILICKLYKINILLYYILFIIISMIWMHINNKESSILTPKYQKTNFYNIFTSSIKKNIDIVINVLGILIFFKVIMKIIFRNPIIFYPYIEILGGHQSINNAFISISALGFLGFSIHLQILTIYPKLNYKKFLISRICYLLLGLLSF